MDPDRLRKWTNHAGLKLPEDLLELWTRTGGGEMFETETLLTPITEDEDGDSVAVVNAMLRRRGLPCTYIVFHIGTGLSAVHVEDERIVELDDADFSERRQFESMESWYSSMLRTEYAQRYGLDDK